MAHLRLNIKRAGTSRCPVPRAKWLGRLGIGAFVFFLIKGLLWLIIPGLAIVAAKL